MLFLMVVSLYSTRILLKALGIDDFGIYNVVGGVVVIFSFVSNTLSSATQRFVSYALGKEDYNLLKKTFRMSATIFIGIGLLLIFFLEIGGTLFLNNQMKIPEDRILAANWVLQFSILTFFITVVTIPFNSILIAYEQMNVYAFLSILECSLKLISAILLERFNCDLLILYSVSIFCLTLLVRILCALYCMNKFEVCKNIHIEYEKKTGKEIFVYSGWNMIGALATVFRQQGMNVIQNLFFGPVVNAAHAVSLQVASALTQFANNVFLATKPSITKLYAKGNYIELWNLVFISTKYSLFLFTFVVIPLYFEMPIILNMWLDKVPPITVEISRLMILSTVIELLCAQIFSVFQAANLLRKVQLYSCSIVLSILPISYLCLKLITANPLIPYTISVLLSFLFVLATLLVGKYQLKLNLINYFSISIIRPGIVTFLTIAVVYVYCSYVEQSLLRVLSTFLINGLVTMASINFIGLDRYEKIKVLKFIKSKIK